MNSQSNRNTEENLLKHLFETSLAGIAIFRASKVSDGRIDDFVCYRTSAQFETLTGLNPQDMLNKPLSVFLPKNKQSSMLLTLAEILETGGAKVFEHYFPWLKRWFEVNAFKVGEDSVAAIFTDITRRKELESEVQRRVHYEDLLSSISLLAVEQTDLKVFLQKCVEKLGEAVEVSRVYLFEHNFKTTCVDNTHEWCAPGIEAQIENLQEIPAQSLEWWMQSLEKDGLISFSDVNDIPDNFTRETLQSQNIVSILVVPLFVNNEYFGFIGFDDCVNYKEWPDEDIRLLFSISRIISSVIERDRDSRQQTSLRAQLIQAQKMESIGRLAGGVAHDFNNMLNVILGHTEMALEDIDPENSVVYNLNEIKEAAVHSAQLTQQLLGFARKQAVTPKVIELNETIRSMLNMLKRLIGENIALSFRAGKDLKTVKIDPVQVDQILANLCVNAKDAISELGSVSIETKNIVLDSSYCLNHIGFIAGEFVQIAVSDNGCGMDAKTLNSIFEPFFTTKTQGKGTGLGLATVYGIVKQNHGFINVYSEPGIGSVFTIYLPVHEGELQQRNSETFVKSLCQGKERILLVEDEVAILNMMKRMLQRMGYTLISTSSPAEAVKMARDSAERIDLLISDIIMPEMNGKDLAERIKRFYPEIKILFMSGYTADVIAHHGILEEGVCFIQKPFSRDQLAEKLKLTLEK